MKGIFAKPTESPVLNVLLRCCRHGQDRFLNSVVCGEMKKSRAVKEEEECDVNKRQKGCCCCLWMDSRRSEISSTKAQRSAQLEDSGISRGLRASTDDTREVERGCSSSSRRCGEEEEE